MPEGLKIETFRRVTRGWRKILGEFSENRFEFVE
jgi:hypothetical protein